MHDGRPEVRQAAAAVALGRVGRDSIPVSTPLGAIQVPVQAFLELLQVVLSRLARGDGKPMAGESEETAHLVGETAISTARAELLAELLAEADSPRCSGEHPRRNRGRRRLYKDAEWGAQILREDAEYDALELFDLWMREVEAFDDEP